MLQSILKGAMGTTAPTGGFGAKLFGSALGGPMAHAPESPVSPPAETLAKVKAAHHEEPVAKFPAAPKPKAAPIPHGIVGVPAPEAFHPAAPIPMAAPLLEDVLREAVPEGGRRFRLREQILTPGDPLLVPTTDRTVREFYVPSVGDNKMIRTLRENMSAVLASGLFAVVLILAIAYSGKKRGPSFPG